MKQSIVLLMALFALPAWADQPRVVASIKPLHSLVAAVMAGDDATPFLLVDGKASLHAFTLKPSQARALEQADLLFYMGDDFELFLRKAPGTAKRIAMERAPGITLYPVRHAEEEEQRHHHEEGGSDLHLWLSVANAKAMVAEIAAQLSTRFPEKKALYEKNAHQLQQRLALLHADLKRRMQAVRNKRIVVYHDAFQYFEKAYGLHFMGSVTSAYAQQPGAKHVHELRGKMQSQPVCLFREPQFEGRVIDNLMQGPRATSGVLDPEGALLPPGPELYFQLMEEMAEGLEGCE